MTRVALHKGQVLYREGDPITGVYLISKGLLKYQKMSEFTVPVEAKTGNKWFREQVKSQNINRKKALKDIAIFEKNQLVGVEEIFREFILAKKKEERMLKEIRLNLQPKEEAESDGEECRDF